MYASKGAGQRLIGEFMAGRISVDPENKSVRNTNGQSFFLTNAGRILRYDGAADQYNVYDHKTKEFVPCDGLNKGEAIVKHGNKQNLFDALLAKPGWGDWFCTKSYNFGTAVGRQILLGTATAAVGSVVGPVIGRTVNRAMDSVGYTATVAKPAVQEAIQQPASQAVKTGLQAKAQGLNAIHGQAISHHAHGGIGHAANGLRAANAQIIHNPPPVPRCPVNDPFFPRGPFGPVGPRPPFGPMVDPIGPWNPWNPLVVDTFPFWMRGLAAGGGTATGAVVGTLVAGPVGGILGGALGAGFGSFVG